MIVVRPPEKPEESALIEAGLPDTTEIEAGASDVVARADALAVTDEDSHRIALESAKECRRRERFVDEIFEPTRAALDSAKRVLLETRDGLKGRYVEARKVLDAKATAFEAEENRKALERQREAEAAAKKAEEERQLQDAILAEEQGASPAEVSAMMAEPVLAPVIPIAPQVAKVAGTSKRENWKGEVNSLEALVKHIAGIPQDQPLAHPEHLPLLEANMTALGGLAKSLKGALRLPGVRVFSESVRSYRS